MVRLLQSLVHPKRGHKNYMNCSMNAKQKGMKMKKILLRMTASLSILLRDFLNTNQETMNAALCRFINGGLKKETFVISEEYYVQKDREQQERVVQLTKSLTPKPEGTHGLKDDEAEE